MALNGDDLQRLRDAIDKGCDFTFCHNIDFLAAVSELVDMALNDELLSGKIYELYPSSDELTDITTELVNIVDGGPTFDIFNELQTQVVRLQEFIDVLDKANDKAEEMLP